MALSFAATNKTVQRRYLDLPQHGKSQVMYVWIDGSGEFMRAKTKTLWETPQKPEDCPIWNYDGSSTGQASGADSDVYLYPVKLYPDPFRMNNNVLCLCECYDKFKKPAETNYRASCAEVMMQVKDHHPWFGMEQEFTLLDQDKQPYGWPKNGYPGPQGPYYCGAGADKVYGRDVIESSYRACFYSNINVSGSNAEVMPAQWEFQVGPCEGIEMGDQLWMARFLMHRVAEDYGIVVSLDPKPVPGDWNGAGCHTNYSTIHMRNNGGMKHILDAIDKLSKKQEEHISVYDPNAGADNKRRLTGKHETASWQEFSYGVANRAASIRIPRQCEDDQKGYLEDRRPSSNCDPYRVTERIVRTTILED